jgi:HNH endonuclease
MTENQFFREIFDAFAEIVKARDGFKCMRCHIRESLTVHHIKPRDAGGTNQPRNLITLCCKCHDWAEEAPRSWAELTTAPEPPEAYIDEKELKAKGYVRIWTRGRFGVESEVIPVSRPKKVRSLIKAPPGPKKARRGK